MRPIRVLIAEDSPTARELLTQILASDPQVTIVGTALDGEQAVALTARLRPDVVTMDVRMPGIDGLEATRRIMAETPTPIVIISGHYERDDVQSSLHALRAGALSILPKPSGPDAPDFLDQCRQLATTVKSMADVKVVRRRSLQSSPSRCATARQPGERPRVIAIAASTGGPAALAQILGELPSTFPLPLLIVQHIAPGFAAGLAGWLDSVTALHVRVATPREPLAAATAYLAPDGHHLEALDSRRLTITRRPAVDGFRPSATVLFESTARTFKGATIAVVLTGMGEDGLPGLRTVHASGGRIIAQDEETSVVFGMPGVAVGAGLADYVLPINAIASQLEALAG
jgi:two-component system chemotaxis response regulator CheB